ncbi:hypothetical protein [Mesoaciditoga lauensis]|uniref:hypothetical protein n=1 Tax=Mesoaciditoga lauensis TaxID=1495039 RepID=UPI00055BC183|nr:hypothetical protein [Mesoaciditoga lauensis]
MKKNKIVVVLLLLFIIAIFGWLGYTLFFPKSSAPRARISSYPQSFKIEAILSKKVSTDYVKPINVKVDPFSPLVVRLNKSDLVSLLKVSISKSQIDKGLTYISGVKSGDINMVTLSLNGKNLTFDFDKSNTHFTWKGNEYVLVYFDPTYEGAVIMNISNGRLYTVTSQGLYD